MKVTDRELEQLEAADNWSGDEGVVRPAVKTQRAIVSVAFTRKDLDLVSEHAERLGLKTSEFIRKSALAEVTRIPQRLRILSISGGFNTVYIPTMRRAPRVEVTMREPELVFTR